MKLLIAFAAVAVPLVVFIALVAAVVLSELTRDGAMDYDGRL